MNQSVEKRITATGDVDRGSADEGQALASVGQDGVIVFRQHVAAFILGAGLAVGCLAAASAYPYRTGGADAGAPEARRIKTGIDPNRAEWAELAQLPAIGPSLAKRIVAFREQRQSGRRQNEPAFRTPADLAAVKGLGPKTLARVRPFLHLAGEDRGR